MFGENWYEDLKSTGAMGCGKRERNVFIFRREFNVGDEIDRPACLTYRYKTPNDSYVKVKSHVFSFMSLLSALTMKSAPHWSLVRLPISIGHVHFSRHKLQQSLEF
jgi:hypothetical protein